jgi:endonuclease/exonuclease/phosphatase family metal-dependent hydrolase
MTALKLMTYNVRRCLGADGRLSPRRIAEIIAASGADIDALQEVDVGRLRSGHVDQATLLAELTGMHAHFHPALKLKEERYGDAILTRSPSRLIKAGLLPFPRGAEPRGALWVRLHPGGMPLDVINTHLGLRPAERRLQVDALLGAEWLGHAAGHPALLLAGDFNALPGGRSHRRLSAALGDGRLAVPGRRRATFPAALPLLALDHIFAGAAIRFLSLDTVATPLARIASDLLPLLAAFTFKAGHDSTAP